VVIESVEVEVLIRVLLVAVLVVIWDVVMRKLLDSVVVQNLEVNTRDLQNLLMAYVLDEVAPPQM